MTVKVGESYFFELYPRLGGSQEIVTVEKVVDNTALIEMPNGMKEWVEAAELTPLDVIRTRAVPPNPPRPPTPLPPGPLDRVRQRVRQTFYLDDYTRIALGVGFYMLTWPIWEACNRIHRYRHRNDAR